MYATLRGMPSSLIDCTAAYVPTVRRSLRLSRALTPHTTNECILLAASDWHELNRSHLYAHNGMQLIYREVISSHEGHELTARPSWPWYLRSKSRSSDHDPVYSPFALSETEEKIPSEGYSEQMTSLLRGNGFRRRQHPIRTASAGLSTLLGNRNTIN